MAHDSACGTSPAHAVPRVVHVPEAAARERGLGRRAAAWFESFDQNRMETGLFASNALLLLSFVVYPSVVTTLFNVFGCSTFELCLDVLLDLLSLK